MTAVNPDTSRQTAVEAALVLLERTGLSPADLTAVPQNRKPVPTFAEYVPDGVGGGERRDAAGIRLVLEPDRGPVGQPAPG